MFNEMSKLPSIPVSSNTGALIAVTAVWHITDHYGQLVEYLRMNGIVPPVTQRYGLKIR